MPHRVVAQRVELPDLEVRAVDHLEAVGAAGHEDLREHVVEVVARVLGDLHTAGEDGHLRRRREVGGPEHDRLEPGRRGADLLDVDEAACRLDLRLDPDLALAAGGLLDLGEEHVERLHVGGRLHLRQHDLVEPLGGVLHDVDDVAVRPLRVPRVDAHAQHGVAPVEVVDRLHDLVAGGLLLEGRDGVLEVEEHHVGAEVGRLAQHLLAGAGHRQAGTAGKVARALGHGSGA